jgi:hypothetical protein
VRGRAHDGNSAASEEKSELELGSMASVADASEPWRRDGEGRKSAQ